MRTHYALGPAYGRMVVMAVLLFALLYLLNGCGIAEEPGEAYLEVNAKLISDHSADSANPQTRVEVDLAIARDTETKVAAINSWVSTRYEPVDPASRVYVDGRELSFVALADDSLSARYEGVWSASPGQTVELEVSNEQVGGCCIELEFPPRAEVPELNEPLTIGRSFSLPELDLEECGQIDLMVVVDGEPVLLGSGPEWTLPGTISAGSAKLRITQRGTPALTTEAHTTLQRRVDLGSSRYYFIHERGVDLQP